MSGPGVDIALRPFDESGFARLTSWLPTEEALGRWCGALFRHPLDAPQLFRHLDGADRSHAPLAAVFTAFAVASGEAIGHVEVSMIWPHLSCRLSRVLVAPGRRGAGYGKAMVARAAAFAFQAHGVARIDLGVAADNTSAIACYERLRFEHVGTWPGGTRVARRVLDVRWMTLNRESWVPPPAPGGVSVG